MLKLLRLLLKLAGKKQVPSTKANKMTQIEPTGTRMEQVLITAIKYIKKYNKDFKKLAH